jgi:TatD DNase family protein
MSASSSSAAASAITLVTSDAAWRPTVPVGHSAYTWTGVGSEATKQTGQQKQPQSNNRQQKPAAPAAKLSKPSMSPEEVRASHDAKRSADQAAFLDRKSQAANGRKTGVLPQNKTTNQPKAGAAGATPSVAPVAATVSAAAASSSSLASAPKPKASAPSKQKGVVKPSSAASSSSPSSSPSPVSLLHHPLFPSVRLTDIGANLTDDMFTGSYHGKPRHQADLQQVMERAKGRGVERIIVTAGNAKESQKVQKIIATANAKASETGIPIPQLYSTVGVHPTRSREWNGSPAHQIAYFSSLLQSVSSGMGAPRTVVAIGECGLDYDRLHFSDKESQLAHFEKHFQLVEAVQKAHGVNLPLFLHDRNTDGDFARIMKQNRARFKHGVVHSFTGSIEDLKAHLELDLYIGINGCSLKTEENLAALHHIPLNRLLLETDAPWCDIKNTHASAALVSKDSRMPSQKPENFKLGDSVKGRNEPGNMVQVLEVVAAHLGVDGIELAEIVWRNTMEVFFPEEKEKEEAKKKEN